MKGKVDDMMNREKQKILEFKAKIDKSNYDQQTFLLFKNLLKLFILESLLYDGFLIFFLLSVGCFLDSLSLILMLL